jgi:hypothetical protein
MAMGRRSFLPFIVSFVCLSYPPVIFLSRNVKCRQSHPFQEITFYITLGGMNLDTARRVHTFCAHVILQRLVQSHAASISDPENTKLL